MKTLVVSINVVEELLDVWLGLALGALQTLQHLYALRVAQLLLLLVAPPASLLAVELRAQTSGRGLFAAHPILYWPVRNRGP
jgi:hypothetical protein